MAKSRTDLAAQKADKLAKISEKQQEIDALESEILQLNDTEGRRKDELKRIENMLEDKYDNLSKQSMSDKKHDTEVSRFEKEIEISLSSKISAYKNSCEAVDSSARFEQFSSMRDPKLTPYKNKLRTIVKSYIEDLKYLFDKVDAEITCLYEDKISCNNMQCLINIMNRIWNEGAYVTAEINSQVVAEGSLPGRCRQKINRWEEVAENVENVEREKWYAEKAAVKKKEIEKEAKARRIVQDKLQSAQADATRLEKKISNLESEITKRQSLLEKETSNLESEIIERQSELEDIKKQLKREMEEYDLSKAVIVSAFNAKKQNIQRKIDEAQARITELEDARQQMQSELARTPALLFGKKKKLCKQIESTTAALLVAVNDKKQKLNELLDEVNDCNNKKNALDTEMDGLKKRFEERKRSAEEAIIALSEELELAPKELEIKKASIPALQKELEQKEASIPALQKELEDFHANYLLKKYGENPVWQQMLKSSRRNQLLDEVAELQRDIVRIDECIKLEYEEQQRIEQKQLEVEKRAKNELAQKESDERIILEQAQQSDGKDKYIISANEISEFVSNNHKSPLDDERKKVITNSIARLKLVQKNVLPHCEKYLVYFADKLGNRISNQRILEQKAKNTVTDVSFEMKAADGFNSSDVYYLLIFDFANGNLISVLPYKINITFANDFDF